ncbi:hypothetical protein G0U57_019113, partial [Chelydra serpentina]
ITLRAGIEIPRIHQYPISREALFGLQELISTFLRWEVSSHQISFQYSILPVRKPDMDPEGKPVYRFV